ncbi:hypothetical protein [Streptomyces sp. ITFR-16]|uniref:hypothetical protein n=1 Tax=Streptomyces sp. ITFR-16 TaxID=3075198 RepID=UPI00288B5C8D|nr:hypothetical protein [Streptomyces sp. ITFR-16]WNI26747.1 hypothetical protein RLT58_34905 [Streptomyces sp. ITFR-16]
MGRPGAVLPDGSEPEPVFFDTGSGSAVHETSDWWVYDGTLGAPLAAGLRGSCSCGWRGTTLYPLDWQEVADVGGPDLYDTEGLEAGWDEHIAGTDARTVPVPDDITALVTQLRTRLDALTVQAPLAALRVVGALERTSAGAGRAAAYTVLDDEQPWDAVATALGLTEDAAHALVMRHTRRY